MTPRGLTPTLSLPTSREGTVPGHSCPTFALGYSLSVPRLAELGTASSGKPPEIPVDRWGTPGHRTWVVCDSLDADRLRYHGLSDYTVDVKFGW